MKEEKFCKWCNKNKKLFSFKKHNHSSDGLSPRCEECQRVYYKQYREKNKERIKKHNAKWTNKNKGKIAKTKRKWRDQNKNKYNAAHALIRARKLNTTPAWADKKQIQEFYQKCPPGYEVDHIVPLNGKNVCGLHVLNNLQYLTKNQNRRKGNKYVDEGK